MTNNVGYWGPGQLGYCEPSYKWSYYLNEPLNSFTSIVPPIYLWVKPLVQAYRSRRDYIKERLSVYATLLIGAVISGWLVHGVNADYGLRITKYCGELAILAEIHYVHKRVSESRRRAVWKTALVIGAALISTMLNVLEVDTAEDSAFRAVISTYLSLYLCYQAYVSGYYGKGWKLCAQMIYSFAYMLPLGAFIYLHFMEVPLCSSTNPNFDYNYLVIIHNAGHMCLWVMNQMRLDMEMAMADLWEEKRQQKAKETRRFCIATLQHWQRHE